MPFEFSETQRRALSTRLMVQAPRGLTAAQLARVHADMDRRLNGIPVGDLLVLEAMMLLADQGNVAAQAVVEDLRDHYGLDPTLYSHHG